MLDIVKELFYSFPAAHNLRAVGEVVPIMAPMVAGADPVVIGGGVVGPCSACT